MGKVVASFKIFPSEAGIELEKLKKTIEKKLPEGVSVYKFEEEPLAFGVNILIAHIILPEDVEGEMDRIEKTLEEIEEIGQVQVLMVRRV
ncbi:elongation factor 1-beta [Candidatus Bathyarchaeota archaeon]|nr:MAG: elongation factor 1-beta [Candidatus Bathyarchaeota archaeon]